MTTKQQSATPNQLSNGYFGALPCETDASDSRLTADMLGRPRIFPLKEICARNPALRDLVLIDERAPITSTLTAATGAFCPALFNDELQAVPMWVCASPHLSGDEVLELIWLEATVLQHSPFGSYPQIYLGWEEGTYTVLLDPTLIGDSLDDGHGHAHAHDKVLICFAGGDSFGVQLITDFRTLCSRVQDASQCRVPKSVLDKLEAARNARRTEMVDDDDIDFGDPNHADVGTGQYGEPAYIMQVRQVGDASRFVPTRALARIALKSDGAADLALDDLRREMLAAARSTAIDRPFVCGMRGHALPSLIPQACHDMPLLVTILPDSMEADCPALANSMFTTINVIAGDPPGSTPHYAFLGGRQHLLLERGRMKRIVDAAVECGELILAFVCCGDVWLRYYQIDSDWLEQDGVTASASSVGSIESAIWENPDTDSEASDDCDDSHISWYPTIYEVSNEQHG